MTLLRTALGMLAVALLAGCGAYTIPGSPSSPSPSPGLGFDVTATEKDHAVTMHVGQKLEVVLHGGTTASWQQVRSSDPKILEPTVDPAATSVRGVTLAAFKAIGPGEATVTAVGTPVCPSGQACPMYAILYSLKVTVTP
jgi:hypothetical protein